MQPLLDDQGPTPPETNAGAQGGSSAGASASEAKQQYGSFDQQQQKHHAKIEMKDIEDAKETQTKFTRLTKSSIASGSNKQQDIDDMAATAACGSLLSCCCCILVLCLIAGSIMTAYSNYKAEGMDEVGMAGRLLLVICGALIASVFLCMCLACCAAPLMKNDMQQTNSLTEPDKHPKYVFKRLNDYFKKDIRLHSMVLSKTSKPLPQKIKVMIDKKIAQEKKDKEKAALAIEKDIEAAISGDFSGQSMTLDKILSKLRPKTYVIDFDGDMAASQVSTLREKVSLVLLVCSRFDQVVVNLKSPGGMVSEYGLVASQLLRLKQAGLRLTICVDVVAASGGYMAACVADKIVAAPFAFIGSIGVIAYVPNFNRVLQKNEVDVFTFTSGQWKRTVDIVGPVTEEAKAKLQQELDDIYKAFKSHVIRNRPQIGDIDRVATGEAWLAQDALALGLVDEIRTSDDLLFDLSLSGDVLKIVENSKKWPGFLKGLDMPDLEERSAAPYNNDGNGRFSFFKSISALFVEAVASLKWLASFGHPPFGGGRHNKVHLV